MGMTLGKIIKCHFCAMLPHPLKFINMFVQGMCKIHIKLQNMRENKDVQITSDRRYYNLLSLANWTDWDVTFSDSFPVIPLSPTAGMSGSTTK